MSNAPIAENEADPEEARPADEQGQGQSGQSADD